MSRAITILDLLNKLNYGISRNRTNVSINDLIELYMFDPMHPQINTEGTFNEKIRMLKRFRILTPVNSQVYRLDWQLLELRIAQLNNTEIEKGAA